MSRCPIMLTINNLLLIVCVFVCAFVYRILIAYIRIGFLYE